MIFGYIPFGMYTHNTERYVVIELYIQINL